jgi:hypothetical protein
MQRSSDNSDLNYYWTAEDFKMYPSFAGLELFLSKEQIESNQKARENLKIISKEVKTSGKRVNINFFSTLKSKIGEGKPIESFLKGFSATFASMIVPALFAGAGTLGISIAAAIVVSAIGGAALVSYNILTSQGFREAGNRAMADYANEHHLLPIQLGQTKPTTSYEHKGPPEVPSYERKAKEPQQKSI